MRASDEIVQKLRRFAADAAHHSYSPYSRFRVGASLLTEDGEIFSACNVENACYGLSMCAERSAVFQAVANGKIKIRAIVIVTDSGRPTPPCGACRQVLSEFGQDIEVFSFSLKNRVLHTKTGNLLPDPFNPESLRDSERG